MFTSPGRATWLGCCSRPRPWELLRIEVRRAGQRRELVIPLEQMHMQF